VEDVVSLPIGDPSWGPAYFVLHSSLEVESLDPDYVVEGTDPTHGGVGARTYTLRPAAGAWPSNPKPRLRFNGRIHHPLVSEGEEYARSFHRTLGIVGEEGVFLSGTSYWVPKFGKNLVTFQITVIVPEGWNAVSQGRRTLNQPEGRSKRVRWTCQDPMDEVYLVAGRFTEYSRPAGEVTAYAFLRTPDPNLAARYLEATAQYLELYGELIGRYPYEKFALVENFWETGYGMPSFTLLGPKVIRLPFILHSSYPHEILHNWWGNSVYVDSGRGNWSEGLTAYLADHLVKEGQGKGAEYRRDTLQGYRSYVSEEKDFPLSRFGERHSSASQSVGYGKSLMLWHMLRLRLGDDSFLEGLRLFYSRQIFRRASFDDLSEIFSEVAGEDLGPFFRQWVEQTGAPALSMQSERVGDDRLEVRIRQDQPGEVYDLTVPLAVTVQGEAKARLLTLPVKERLSKFEFRLPAPALRVDLDPSFDVFRQLDRSETPPTLSELLGEERVTVIVPEKPRSLAVAWREFARSWAEGASGGLEVVEEQDVEALPANGAVWVLGTNNRWRRSLIPALRRYGAGLTGGEIQVGKTKLPEEGHSFAFATRHPENPAFAVAWIGGDDADALPGLARKLPHYGRYSYLAFSGDEPTNVAKGLWPVLESPLTQVLSAASPGAAPPFGELPPREPLGRLPPVFDAAPIMAHVRYLAADQREGRGIGTDGLREAAEYIAEAFRRAGLEPGGDEGSYFQTWSEREGPKGESVVLRNVIGVLPGKREEWRNESVVIGAHYDHLGRGWPDVRSGEGGHIHNGADDNASGVAVLLELAALLGQELEPDRSILFVAFSAEEWDRKGSRRYVETMKRWPVEECLAMVNLDTVGRLEGKKIRVLGAGTATEWIHIVMGVGFTTGIEASAIMDDPGGSDQTPFHERGVPAVQIFSGPHEDYHRPSDDVERIDSEGLVKVARFVREMAVYLSERDQPLTSSLETGGPGRAAEKIPARRASLGTVPDYSFAGPGVRVTSVRAGSPAAIAGLRAGDVLRAIDGREITDVRSYAAVLREHRPGDKVRIQIRRGEEELSLEAELVAR
jgi:hypothetical protein